MAEGGRDGPARLVVVSPGAFSTLQDRGRPGFRAWGVPVAGAFDPPAWALANALAGNDPGDNPASVEMTMVGGTYRVEGAFSLAIGLAGAPMVGSIRRERGVDRPVLIPGSTTLEPGDTLALGGCPVGLRAYLAARGGWRGPTTLGSRSAETPLPPGAVLEAPAGVVASRRLDVAGRDSPPTTAESPRRIRCVDGPDAARLVDPSTFWGRPFRVSGESNRVGLRLEGDPVGVIADPGRLSRPVDLGAVQVAGTSPIVLGVAGGTMGGYPHVAHVASVDRPKLGQLRPGDWVAFEKVEVIEARRLDRLATAELRARLAIVRAAALDPLGRK